MSYDITHTKKRFLRAKLELRHLQDTFLKRRVLKRSGMQLYLKLLPLSFKVSFKQ